ncbi:MAG: hypothetical protein KDD61_00925 [Bdellovibrionales bacterium]|nr:hypothetical protein [Bdellovibrionales bacterium]
MTQLFSNGKKIILFVGLVAALTGCNQGEMKSFTAGPGNATGGESSEASLETPPEINQSLKDIDSELDQADQAIVDAIEAMDGVVKDGSIDVFSVEQLDQQASGELGAQGLFGISDKLDKVFDKAIDGIKKAKDAIGKARTKLQDALSQLDPLNPLHAPMIVKLNELLQRLDDVENRFDAVIDQLADKVDQLMQMVDSKIAQLQGPWAIPALLLVEELRQSVEKFKSKLSTL